MLSLLFALWFALVLVGLPIALIIVLAVKWPRATEKIVLEGFQALRNRPPGEKLTS